MIPERLAQREALDVKRLTCASGFSRRAYCQILGVPEVDSAVDCVGFEAKGQAEQTGTEQPAYSAEFVDGAHSRWRSDWIPVYM